MNKFTDDKRTGSGCHPNKLKVSVFDQKLQNKKIFPVLVDKNYLASKLEQKVKNKAKSFVLESPSLSFQWILKVECLRDVRRVRLPPFFLSLNKQDANISDNQYLDLPLVEYEEIVSYSCALFNMKKSDKHALKYLDDEGEWCTLTVDNVKDALTLSVLGKEFGKKRQNCSDVVSNCVRTCKEESTCHDNNMKSDNHSKNSVPTSRINDGRKNSQNGKMEYKWVVSNNNRKVDANTVIKVEEAETTLLFSLPAADISAILHLQLCLNDGFVAKLNGLKHQANKINSVASTVSHKEPVAGQRVCNNNNNDSKQEDDKGQKLSRRALKRRRRKKKRELNSSNNEGNNSFLYYKCNDNKENINVDGCRMDTTPLLLIGKSDKNKITYDENVIAKASGEKVATSPYQTVTVCSENDTRHVNSVGSAHNSNESTVEEEEKKETEYDDKKKIDDDDDTKKIEDKTKRTEYDNNKKKIDDEKKAEEDKKKADEEQKVSEESDDVNNVSINSMKNGSEVVNEEKNSNMNNNSVNLIYQKRESIDLDRDAVTDQKYEMDDGTNSSNWMQQICEEEDFVMINSY